MVVSSSGKKGLRSFKIERVVNHEGCDTKFDKNSRLISRHSRNAAMKAFNDLCVRKSIKNRCTFLVGVKETTQGSKKRGTVKIYKCKREKLSKPLSLKLGKSNVTFKYKTSAKSKKSFPICKGKSKQGKSSGPMKNKPSKKSQN